MKANTIEEFFGTLLQSVTETHKKHLMTGKYSGHKALNEFYDEMPELVDALVEHWQGIHGKVESFKNDLLSDNMGTIEYLEELLDMCEDAKESLLDEDDALNSDVDDIIGQISSTLYQLKELKEGMKPHMKSLSVYLKESLNESGFDRHLLYDIIISVVNNNQTIYERCKSLAAAIARKAKQDERPDFNKLAESSTVDKLTTEVFKIYVSEYSSPGMRLGTPERKELKKWVAAKIFHILDDEFKGLTPEEIKEFENNPYFNISDFDKTIK